MQQIDFISNESKSMTHSISSGPSYPCLPYRSLATATSFAPSYRFKFYGRSQMCVNLSLSLNTRIQKYWYRLEILASVSPLTLELVHVQNLKARPLLVITHKAWTKQKQHKVGANSQPFIMFICAVKCI